MKGFSCGEKMYRMNGERYLCPIREGLGRTEKGIQVESSLESAVRKGGKKILHPL